MICCKEAAQIDTNTIATIGLGINIVLVLVVLGGLIWRIPSKEDVKRVENKADNANKQNLEIRGDIKVLTGTVERIESWFDPPALKSSRRRSGTDE